MARGFLNARHKTGGAAAVNEYQISTTQTIAEGDLVGLASGEIVRVAATVSGSDSNTTVAIIGVAASSKTSDGSGVGNTFPTSLTTNVDQDGSILVYDDLANTVFETSVATVAATDVGGAAKLVNSAPVTIGSQTVGRQSADATFAGTAAVGKSLVVLGAVKRPGNSLGTDATVDCYVQVKQ